MAHINNQLTNYRYHDTSFCQIAQRLRGFVPFLMLVIMLLSFPLAAKAQEEDDYFDLSPEQLLDLTVYSASKKESSLFDTAAAIYIVTQEDIERSGVTSLPEALRMVPGVHVAQSGSSTWAISIRGFQEELANKILVMIDGRVVYNPLFSGTYWEAHGIPLENIERIEVVKGPGGALWGANAVNGIVNILTKKAQDTQGTLISAGAGNYDSAFVTARQGARIGAQSFVSVYGRYSSKDDFISRDNDRAAYDNWQTYRTGFRVDSGDEGAADQFSFHGDLYQVDSRQYNTTYSLSAPYAVTDGDVIRSIGSNLFGQWAHSYEDGSSFRIQSYIDYTLRNEALLRDDRWAFDTEVQYNFKPLGRHEITVGAGFRHSRDNLESRQVLAFTPASRADNLYSFFLQDTITLDPEHLFLILGSKVEHNNYTGVEVQPSAKLLWKPTETQTVWGSLSRAVRTPNRLEHDLDITNVVLDPAVFGLGLPVEIILQRNGDFDSEELLAYELGYRNQITPEFSVDTAAFINRYDELSSAEVGSFVLVPAGVDPAHFELPISAVNEMTGTVYGFEASANWQVRPNWELNAGYSFLNMVLHAPPIITGNQDGEEDQTPQHQVSLRSYWDIDDRWSLDSMLYYVDQIAADDAPSYLRFDLNLGLKITDNIKINLVGQNLLEASHHEFGTATGSNTTEVPRALYGKMTWEF